MPTSTNIDYVSEHTDSAHVTSIRPMGPHIEIVRWPAKECPDINPDTGYAFDVYVRRSQNEKYAWPIHEEHGAFVTSAESIEAALELANDLGIPIIDVIKEPEL